jgi:hypothetical protein
MASKLIGMAEGVIFRLATDDRRRLSETLKSSLARVIEMTMPGGQGGIGHKRVPNSASRGMAWDLSLFKKCC